MNSVAFDFACVDTLKAKYDMRMVYPEYKRKHYGHYDADKCIFHDDTRPSMLIFSNGYRCRGCGAHGDVIRFIQETQHLSFVDACVALLDGLPHLAVVNQYTQSPPPPSPVYTDEPKILSSGMVESDYRELTLKTGIDKMTAIAHMIGRFNPGVFSIPIQNPDDKENIVDVKLYRPGASHGELKTWHYMAGAHNYLYGLHHLNGDDFAIIKGGEKDTILGHQAHLPSVTATSGEGSWDEKFNKYLSERRELYCWLDADDAGREGSIRVKRRLRRVILCDWSVLYDSSVPSGFDFADFYNEGGTADLFREMLENAKKGIFSGRIKPVLG